MVLASPSFDVLTNILTIPSFKKVKAKCYRDHREGFYVYAKPNNRPPNVLTKYIGRYLGRPVIEALRIDNYNEKNVTCPCCGQTMVFLEIYDNHQHNSLSEMHEMIMAKFYASSA